MGVVHAFTAGMARDEVLMHYFMAWCQIGREARHVAGIHNIAADALSRNKMTVFFKSSPQACREAVKVSTPLLDMLLIQRPDWLSPTWRRLFLSSCSKHWPPPQCDHTGRGRTDS